VNILLVSVV